MRVLWICSTIAAASVVLTLSVFWPGLLAGNKFLEAFATHEVLSFLVVILTITLASVANIHLTVHQSQARIVDQAAREKLEREAAGPLRAETKSSAWLLFWGLIVCIVAAFVKGVWPDSQFVLSLAHGTVVIIVILNFVVLYDIYETVFALVGVESGK